jgi:hypothetical protein
MRIGLRIGKNQLILAAIAFVTACGSDGVVDPGKAPPRDGSLELKPLSATKISGVVGEPVADVPAVVVSKGGRPAAGVTVSFAPYGVTSSVANATAVTNAQGIATAGEWKLGTTSGEQALRASISNSQDAFFFAQAAPAAPAELQSAHAIGEFGLPGFYAGEPSVYVRDRFGNRVGLGVGVSFSVTSGGGRLAQTQTHTDANGFASAGSWYLGTGPGINAVVASAPGLDPVTFTVESEDIGQLSWYDLEAVDDQPLDRDSESIYSVGCCWIALSDSGSFLLLTNFGWIGSSQFRGTYTASGTEIVLTYSNGRREEGTLLDGRLSIYHEDDLTGGGMWTYVGRTERLPGDT